MGSDDLDAFDKPTKFLIDKSYKFLYEETKAQLDEAIETLKFYGKDFDSEGCWIGGPLYKDQCHGNDMQSLGSFAVGGKRAREFLKKVGRG